LGGESRLESKQIDMGDECRLWLCYGTIDRVVLGELRR